MQRIRMAFAIRFYYDYSFYPSKRIEICDAICGYTLTA